MRRGKTDSVSEQYKIMVVDDEIGIINSVSVMLKRSGYSCEGFTDPIEAVQVLKSRNYDILILDYLMQSIHGDEVIKMIREFDNDIYIILLTGHKDIAPPLLTIKAFEIQAYCEKSDKFDQLMLLVESAKKSVSHMKVIKSLNDSLNTVINSMEKIHRFKPMEQMLKEILMEAQQLVEYENGFILIYENSEVELLSRKFFKGIGLYDESLDVFTNTYLPLFKEHFSKSKAGARSVKLDQGILFPLNNDQFGALGVLYLEVGDFKEYEKIMEIFLRQVSAALNNALLHLILNAKNEEIRAAYSEIDKLYKIMENNYKEQLDKNEFLKQAVNSRTAAIKNLLDNAGQGFLAFGSDLIIDSEYSSECINLFGDGFESERFSSLISKNDKELSKFIDGVFLKLLEEKDDLRREVYISLLPDEIQLNGKCIQIQYKIINSSTNSQLEKIIVILTDITQRRCLEREMEKEKLVLQMVVKVVVNYSDFNDCIEDFLSFNENKLSELLNDSSRSFENVILEVFRKIHTLKGSFASLELRNAAFKLQECEDKISEYMKDLGQKSIEDFRSFLFELNIKNVLDEDLKLLKGILGDELLIKKNMVSVDREKLMEIQNKMLSLLSDKECKILIPEIRKLTYKPFGTLLKSYTEYVLRLSEKVGKNIYPFETEGEDVLVDTDIFTGFARSLVHVFRNIVDHGIEYPEERIAQGKDAFGTIKCNIKSLDSSIIITISDDGCGIGIGQVTEKAVEKGILEAGEVLKLEYEDVLNLIFLDGLSTKEEANEISGRGLGLAVVKSELEKLNGTVRIETKPELGTEFIFTIPLNRDNEP